MPYKDPASSKLYYQRNREKILRASKEFRDSNKEMVSLRKKEEYRRNREKRLIKAKENWHAKPYWEQKFHNGMVKAREKASEIVDTDSIREYFREVYSKEFDICTYCRQTFPIESITIDHKTPYALNGRHEVSNLVVSCLQCNMKKSSRPLNVWMSLIK